MNYYVFVGFIKFLFFFVLIIFYRLWIDMLPLSKIIADDRLLSVKYIELYGAIFA